MVEPQDNLGLWSSQLSNPLGWICFKPSKIESMLKYFAQYWWIQLAKRALCVFESKYRGLVAEMAGVGL